MATDLVKISFTGKFGRQVANQSYITELGGIYNVSQRAQMKFSQVDVGNNANELLTLTITIAYSIGNYLKGKGLEYLFKEGLLAPFANWLEKVETNLDGIVADEIEYKFDDITIRIGCSKKNHIHIASLICNKVIKLKEIFNKEKIGDITLVASPLIKDKNHWKFIIPNEDFPISKFTDFLGIELNNQNRCIISSLENVITYEKWE